MAFKIKALLTSLSGKAVIRTINAPIPFGIPFDIPLLDAPSGFLVNGEQFVDVGPNYIRVDGEGTDIASGSTITIGEHKFAATDLVAPGATTIRAEYTGGNLVNPLPDNAPVQTETLDVDIQDIPGSITNALNLVPLPQIPGFPPLPPLGDLAGSGFKIAVSPSVLTDRFPFLKQVADQIDDLAARIDEVVPDYTLLSDPNSPLATLLNKALCGFDFYGASRIRMGGLGLEVFAISTVFGSVLSSAFRLIDALRGKIPQTGIDCLDAELARLTSAVATAVKVELIQKTSVTNALNRKIRDLTDRTNRNIREELRGLVGESTMVDISTGVDALTVDVSDIIRREMDPQGRNAGNRAADPFVPPPPPEG